MDLLPRQASPPLVGCPAWCAGVHVPVDGRGAMHVSRAQAIPASSGFERTDIYVSVERADVDGRPLELATVRLDGCGPMAPLQALQLATALQFAAFAALADGGVLWPPIGH